MRNFGEATFRGGDDKHVAQTRDSDYIIVPEEAAANPDLAVLLGARMPDVVPGMEEGGSAAVAQGNDEQSQYEAAMMLAEFIEDTERNFEGILSFIDQQALERKVKAEKEAKAAEEAGEEEEGLDAAVADEDAPPAPRERKPGKAIVATLIGEDRHDVTVLVAEANGFTREPTIRESTRERRRRVNRPRRRQML